MRVLISLSLISSPPSCLQLHLIGIDRRPLLCFPGHERLDGTEQFAAISNRVIVALAALLKLSVDYLATREKEYTYNKSSDAPHPPQA
jgi:hypothetical protein